MILLILLIMGTVFSGLVILLAVKREGEWDKFKDNNRKQPKDWEL